MTRFRLSIRNLLENSAVARERRFVAKLIQRMSASFFCMALQV